MVRVLKINKSKQAANLAHLEEGDRRKGEMEMEEKEKEEEEEKEEEKEKKKKKEKGHIAELSHHEDQSHS